MKAHFSTVEAARAVVEPFLRSWEVDADLRLTRGELRFDFSGADIVDRTPPPPGVIHGTAYIVLPRTMVSATGTIHATRIQYPDPPGIFRLNPDAQIILDRYYRYLDGREPLLPMAYFCLTQLELNVGGRSRRSRAATLYRIDKKVLDTVGVLATKHGDRMSARKASATQPLTASESVWLEAAVKKLIWQLGTPEASRSRITMADLPTL